jgi:hypothetical protein
MALSDEVKKKLQAGKSKVAFSRADAIAALKRKPHPDPLADVEYTDDLEKDSKAELNALGKGLSGASAEWSKQFRGMNDTEFWVALCFPDRETKEKFLNAAGLLPLGDKYLDGPRTAKALGIDIDAG